MRKRLLAVVLGITCTFGIHAAQTTSYLTTKNQIANHLYFAGENGLNGILTEPSWNPEDAKLLVAGKEIKKDPQITNTSEINLDALVSMKIEFVYSDQCPDPEKRGKPLEEDDMQYVAELFEIDYNADSHGDWIRFEKESKKDPVQQFYYSSVLKRNGNGTGDTTIPLFTKIKIKKSAGTPKMKRIQDMGGINILVSGKMIQHMKDEHQIGLDSAKEAYAAGLLDF